MFTNENFDLFKQALSEGWSVQPSFKRAKVDDLTREEFLKQFPEAKDLINKYRKHLYNKKRLQMNQVHPTSIIGPQVKLGTGNFIGPYCVFDGEVEIGNNNIFTSHCSISHPQNREKISGGHVVIGSNNVFREFVSIAAPTYKITQIGDDCYFMSGSHISHDSEIQHRVTFDNGVMMGGHCTVLGGAYIGIGVVLNKGCVIGNYSAISAGSVVNQNSHIEPGYLFSGNPVIKLGHNREMLDKFKVSDNQLHLYRKIFHQIMERKHV